MAGASKKQKGKYWMTQYKFGIKVPKTVREALEIDKEANNTLWLDAIRKEMANVRVAFEEWQDGTYAEIKARDKLVGYQEIKCHMIFDIKMDFTRKARFVAGGHTTDPPTSLTYSSVVSRESVRIALLVAALHDVDVCAADVGNAYLNAPCREKIFTIAGPEFQSESGRVMIIKRALYGLKSSGAAWRNMLATSLTDLGYTSSLADPDVWTKPNVKENGYEYYEMILVYVDDILVISHDTKEVMDKLMQLYRLKPESIGPPKRYLGATIEQVQLCDGRSVWSMSAAEYIHNAVNVVNERKSKEGVKGLNRRQRKRPYHHNYKPEIDVSEVLDSEATTWYQQLIGMLRWICELGRIDILYEVSKLSSHCALPRKGHLEAAYNIFAHLEATASRKIVFDDHRVDIDPSCFTQPSWTDFYPNTDTKLPPNMLEPRGLSVKITGIVDADLAGDLRTRRSQTGVIVFVNNAPIVAFSKRQNTVESSTFGSEFVAMRVAVELCESLRYKLQMFGIGIDGPIDVLCDNNAVVKSSSIPQSVLAKKHTSICFHRVRESVAAGIIQVAKVHTNDNLADLLTKCLNNDVRNRHIQSILHD
jgi:Reverse transcriptase (RNA-dependent DNA polymerase)